MGPDSGTHAIVGFLMLLTGVGGAALSVGMSQFRWPRSERRRKRRISETTAVFRAVADRIAHPAPPRRRRHRARRRAPATAPLLKSTSDMPSFEISNQAIIESNDVRHPAARDPLVDAMDPLQIVRTESNRQESVDIPGHPFVMAGIRPADHEVRDDQCPREGLADGRPESCISGRVTGRDPGRFVHLRILPRIREAHADSRVVDDSPDVLQELPAAISGEGP